MGASLIPFSVRVTSYMPEFMAEHASMQRAIGGRARGTRIFYDMVREGLEAAGLLWLEEYRPRHFAKQAFYRYGYRPRSSATQQLKRIMEARQLRPLRREESGRGDSSVTVISAGGRKLWVKPGPFVNEALYWTGDMKQSVLGRSAADFLGQRRTTVKNVGGSGQVVELRIPVSLGHPVRPETAAEVTTLTQEEWSAMSRRAHQVLIDRLSAHRTMVRETIDANQ